MATAKINYEALINEGSFYSEVGELSSILCLEEEPIFDWNKDLNMCISLVPYESKDGRTFMLSIDIQPDKEGNEGDLIGLVHAGLLKDKVWEDYGIMGYMLYKNGEWVESDAV